MESSDSLASQAISLPPTISEKPTNLPPALPPKRHRTANRLNNLNASPPSSPNYITNEPIESPSSESSHHIANTTSHTPHNNNISKLPANEIIVPRKQIAPISPSSNYVQITTCTMNAAAAAAAAANSMKYSSTSSASKDSMSAICLNGRTNGESTEAKTSPSDTPAVNDVRVIYTNVNHFHNSNNRLPDETISQNGLMLEHNMHTQLNHKQSDRLSTNSDKECVINNNNTLKNANAIDNEDDIVVLRHHQISPKDNLKVSTTVSISTFHLLHTILFIFGISEILWRFFQKKNLIEKWRKLLEWFYGCFGFFFLNFRRNQMTHHQRN